MNRPPAKLSCSTVIKDFAPTAWCTTTVGGSAINTPALEGEGKGVGKVTLAMLGGVGSGEGDAVLPTLVDREQLIISTTSNRNNVLRVILTRTNVSS